MEASTLYPSSTILGKKLKDPRTLREAYEEFHRRHPDVYDEIVSLARMVKARGFKKYSVHAIWEVLRWNHVMRRDPGVDYKFNDHHPPYYAREIMDRKPDLEGFFNVRPLKANRG